MLPVFDMFHAGDLNYSSDLFNENKNYFLFCFRVFQVQKTTEEILLQSYWAGEILTLGHVEEDKETTHL